MAVTKKSLLVQRLRRTQLTDLLSKGTRLDGRKLLERRPLSIVISPIEKASGSARVKLGNTEVIAGVKIELGTPFPDSPDKGILIVNTEVLPLSSPYAEPGPPSEEAIEVARVVDRGIRESEMVDMSKLGLVKGKKVQAIFADVTVLNHDGNLLDAVSYAVTSALASAKIRRYKVTGEEVTATDEFVPLEVQTLPASITIARIGDVLIVDPNMEEEAMMDARITFTTDDRGNICAGQKGSAQPLSLDQIKLAASLAREQGNEIRDLIRGAIT